MPFEKLNKVYQSKGKFIHNIFRHKKEKGVNTFSIDTFRIIEITILVLYDFLSIYFILFTRNF